MNLETVYTAAMTKQAGFWTTAGSGLWKLITHPVASVSKHPKISASVALMLSTLGAGIIGGHSRGRDEVAQTSQPNPPDPFIEGMKKFPNMGKQNWINTAAGIGAGAATGIGLHEALKAVPGLKKRKILRATLATLGGGGAGYLAWRAADNYQNASNNNQTA